MKTETNATRSAVGIQNSRQLADLAVQIVIGQIQQATQTSTSRTPGTVAWASQPGMIRLYGSSATGGVNYELEWYKLYSAQNMTVAFTGTTTPRLNLIQADLPRPRARPARETGRRRAPGITACSPISTARLVGPTARRWNIRS